MLVARVIESPWQPRNLIQYYIDIKYSVDGVFKSVHQILIIVCQILTVLWDNYLVAIVHSYQHHHGNQAAKQKWNQHFPVSLIHVE